MMTRQGSLRKAEGSYTLSSDIEGLNCKKKDLLSRLEDGKDVKLEEEAKDFIDYPTVEDFQLLNDSVDAKI